MLAHNVIVVDELPERIENSIINKSLNYALISVSYTNRMMDPDQIGNRIQNMTKGKIAEYLFQYYVVQQKMQLDFKSCQTPFYLPDKRDFLMGEYEWDIKNSFVRTPQKLTSEKIIELPALIPNRPSTPYFTDQWEKRNEMKHPVSKGVRYVFTYMERPIQNDFIDIFVHPKLKDFYLNIKKNHPYQNAKEPPFTESWFWNEISKVDFPKFKLNQKLRLYITGWAGEEQFPLFYNTEKRNFDGMIYTRIKNKTIKIHRLPAFGDLIYWFNIKKHIMANTYTQLNVQGVFSVQGKRNFLLDSFRPELFKYISGTLKKLGQYPLAVNGYKDHVHIFFELHPASSVSQVLQEVKSNSSGWINRNKFLAGKFSWQKGFGAFSYSRSQRDNVINYIKIQEQHHRGSSFKKEYLELLRKFEIEYKDAYIFEFYED
jgi:REP element-mobilizing transposase RayT